MRLRVSLAVVLLSVLACKTSASYSSSSGSGTTAPGSGDNHGKPAQFPAGDGGAAPTGDGGASAGGGSSAPAACVTAMNDSSTSLFSGRIVIRLPKGLEMVEQNSFFAVAAAPQTTTSCGGVIRYAAVGFFQYPGSTELLQVRDHLMSLRGISPENLTWTEEGTRGHNYTAVYAAPTDKNGAPETRGWLVMRDAPGDKYLYFAMFESEPAAFDGLKAAFQESGRRLLVKPGAQQGGDIVEAPPDKPTTKPKPGTKKPVAK